MLAALSCHPNTLMLCTLCIWIVYASGGAVLTAINKIQLNKEKKMYEIL